jgi:putative transposase
MGIEAIYRRPNTSKPALGHRIYPYLLRALTIDRSNHVWATDITYIPMARGFVYLTAAMDFPAESAPPFTLDCPWRLDCFLRLLTCPFSAQVSEPDRKHKG